MSTPTDGPAPRGQPSPAGALSSVARLRGGFAQLQQPQASTAARERRDLLVLLFAVALVVVPHFRHLAWWATALLIIFWSWRVRLTIARRPLPGRLAMLPLLFAAAGAVWVQHGSLIGRDASITFLLLLMGLKLLELRARRDIFVVIFLAFFILLTQFLFGQGLLIAALALLAVFCLFVVLISVHGGDTDLPASRKLRTGGLILLKALPLTVAMFVLFPRISGPLWGMPGGGAAARSGLSDSMSPGSINELIESSAVAFRVRFAQSPPAAAQLYWRGPVFGNFDGKTWSATPNKYLANTATTAVRAEAGSAVDYEVTLEPHARDWLFALEIPTVPNDSPLQPRLTTDWQLRAGRAIDERVRYQVRSYTRFAAGLEETDASLQDALALPPSFNPRALQFAADLQRQVFARLPAGTDTSNRHAIDATLVTAVIDRLRAGGYQYSLSPPKLVTKHSVDEFLFDTRIGFCEHYASAFVVLMRALDVPARVVTGYQGGEINQVDGFLTVRQSDAHAWAEVWLTGRGWTRIDPTAAVAPLRIERGAPEIARAAGFAPLLSGGGPFAWLRPIRMNLEAIENAWNQWVLSYSQQRQRELLTGLGIVPTWQNLAITFGVTMSVLLAILGYWSLRNPLRVDPLARLLAQMRARLNAAGIPAGPSEGPRTLAVRLPQALDPTSAAEGTALLNAIERARYARLATTTPLNELRALRRRVARFRPLPRTAR